MNEYVCVLECVLCICMCGVHACKRVGYVLIYMCKYFYEWEYMNMCVREHESILCDYVCMFM